METPSPPATPLTGESRPSSKMARRFSTLKFRLMLLITGVLVAVVGAPVAWFVYSLDKNYREFASTMLEITTDFVYQRIEPDLIANDAEGVQERMQRLAEDPRIQTVRIFDPEGVIVYSSEPSERQRHITELSDSTFYRRHGRTVEAFTRVGNVYAHHHPLYVQPSCASCHEPGPSPIATLDVHASFVDSEYINRYAKQLSITGGIAIIVFLWIITNGLYASQIESRLHRLLKGFDAVAGGRYDTRVEMEGNHEIAALARGFNRMAEEVELARKRESAYYVERLERADRLVTLGEIAAEIAHEVNNPAGIILSRAELVREELAERGDSEEDLEDLDMIIRQTGRIAETTRSILHYARKRPTKYEQTDIGEVITRSVKVLQPRIKKYGASIEVHLPEDPITIRANGDQLEQVFCNLINNSLDAAVNSGDPSISIRCRSERPEGRRAVCRVTVEDNGPGIAPELVDQVFSPFFTTKSEDKGTGLGLFIVRNIVQSHGGAIALSNSDSRGARFVIDLPFAHGDA